MQLKIRNQSLMGKLLSAKEEEERRRTVPSFILSHKKPLMKIRRKLVASAFSATNALSRRLFLDSWGKRTGIVVRWDQPALRCINVLMLISIPPPESIFLHIIDPESYRSLCSSKLCEWTLLTELLTELFSRHITLLWRLAKASETNNRTFQYELNERRQWITLEILLFVVT